MTAELILRSTSDREYKRTATRYPPSELYLTFYLTLIYPRVHNASDHPVEASLSCSSRAFSVPRFTLFG
jgi:hypothetical protein